MLKRNAAATCVFVLVLPLLLSGCFKKTRLARDNAEAALEEARARDAGERLPEVFRLAESHYDQGRRQQYFFRPNMARTHYTAAEEDALLAVRYIDDGRCQDSCPPCPGENWSDSGNNDACCLEYNHCSKELSRLEGLLDKCRASKTTGKTTVKTRTVYVGDGVCDAPAPKSEPSSYGELMMGTLTVQGPGPIQRDKTDYEVLVRYHKSVLDKRSAGVGKIDNDYRILLDVASVEPAEVVVGSPTVDFQPLGKDGGKWRLPVTVPEGVSGPVSLEVVATLRNMATGKEQKLPAHKVVIPDGSACPECAPAAKGPEVVPTVETKTVEKNGLAMPLILLVLGLLCGFGAGYVVFRMILKSGPAIRP